MLDWSAILACMPVEYSSAMPDPDEFDQQLRDLTSGQAKPAKFTELSAAERARRSASQPPPPPGKIHWRKARKARQLRRPIGEQQPKRGGPTGAKRRRPAAPQRKPPSGSQRRRRLISFARTVGVLVAFAALLYGLHLLGFGPQ
jgi:hypothetical protein